MPQVGLVGRNGGLLAEATLLSGLLGGLACAAPGTWAQVTLAGRLRRTGGSVGGTAGMPRHLRATNASLPAVPGAGVMLLQGTGQ